MLKGKTRLELRAVRAVGELRKADIRRSGPEIQRMIQLALV
jgi:hypothetical protein